eukprot:5854717-Alexandrium_andersonii.AAC.1
MDDAEPGSRHGRGSAKAKAKGKAKAKAGGGSGKVKQLSGRAAERQAELLKAVMEEATDFKTTVLEVASLAGFKELESEAKD